MKHRLTPLAAVLVTLGCSAAPAPQPDSEAELSAELQEVRAATQKYQDIEVAVADGYMPDPMGYCVTAEMEGEPRQLGAMGIHYFRPDLLGLAGPPNPRVAGNGTHTDFNQPGVLIYEPQADGSFELVAIENLVFEGAWRAAGNEAAPSFEGNDYYHMVDNPRTDYDEAHMFEPHYELHMWLYEDNPSGMYAPFNPNATCEHHDPSRPLPGAMPPQG